jgi:peptidylprolyl isomerase/peptidyl-prolyl cis-trans isomerase A (cyclophilin A)
MTTNMGVIVLELDNKKAPITVGNFAKLAGEGFYNGIKFHRVIKGFMLQGGDPLTKDDSMQSAWGTGGPGYKFADEKSGLSNVSGTISMANAGPNTNGSQFFINTNNNAFLDGKHTVFGKVISGLEIVQKIENTKTGGQDRPVEAVVMNSVTVE